MENNIFYEIVDEQIIELISEFGDKELLKKFNKKSFGFLLWLLNRYLPDKDLNEAKQFITEGSDDNSCDLIFNNTDNLGNLVFYVVQAKWFQKQRIGSSNELKKEIRACLTDFNLILKGRKNPSAINENFNVRYEEFLKHKNNNGKIKFIFAALCKGPDIQDYVKAFKTKLVSFELFDINLLKKHFIELTYKEAKTHNPIETPYEPKGRIKLSIEKSDFIELRDPFPYKAYIFLVKPSVIADLFGRYGFALFYKNIRNPLPTSSYNTAIENTLKNDPLNFWYFNNGITAITTNIYDFHSDSGVVEVNGLQVINGAQTVYAIYSAFRDAHIEEKSEMDKNALIALRILRSGGRKFDLKVTRYTNSQNPMLERDFHSNDDVQKRIQDDFMFNTNVWYETRRGEFRTKGKGLKKFDIQVIPNQKLAQTYLAFSLAEPLLAKSRPALIFFSKNAHKEGLYEKIFNEETKYDDMLVSFYLFKYIETKRKEYKKRISRVRPRANGTYSPSNEELLKYSFLQYASFDVLALFKPLLIRANKNKLKGINGKLLTYFKNDKYTLIAKYYNSIVRIMRDFIVKKMREDRTLQLSVYFKNKATYAELKHNFMNKLNRKLPPRL